MRYKVIAVRAPDPSIHEYSLLIYPRNYVSYDSAKWSAGIDTLTIDRQVITAYRDDIQVYRPSKGLHVFIVREDNPLYTCASIYDIAFGPYPRHFKDMLKRYTIKKLFEYKS